MMKNLKDKLTVTANINIDSITFRPVRNKVYRQVFDQIYWQINRQVLNNIEDKLDNDKF